MKSKLYKFLELDETAKKVAIKNYIKKNVDNDILDLEEVLKLQICEVADSLGYVIGTQDISFNYDGDPKYDQVKISKKLDSKTKKEIEKLSIVFLKFLKELKFNETAISFVLVERKDKFDVNGVLKIKGKYSFLGLGKVLGWDGFLQKD